MIGRPRRKAYRSGSSPSPPDVFVPWQISRKAHWRFTNTAVPRSSRTIGVNDMTQKKKTEESWVSATAKALYADTVAKNTPRGTLGRKHTEQIALRYALQSRAIYRWNLFKKFL